MPHLAVPRAFGFTAPSSSHISSRLFWCPKLLFLSPACFVPDACQGCNPHSSALKTSLPSGSGLGIYMIDCVFAPSLRHPVCRNVSPSLPASLVLLCSSPQTLDSSSTEQQIFGKLNGYVSPSILAHSPPRKIANSSRRVPQPHMWCMWCHIFTPFTTGYISQTPLSIHL